MLGAQQPDQQGLQQAEDGDAWAERLVRQLDRSVDGHVASGEAFVASVYGEWGVGKTHCLARLHAIYRQRLDERLPGLLAEAQPLLPLLLPVAFDPWRYEHEEHLIVPLLKTLQQRVAELDGPLQLLAQREHSGGDAFVQRAQAIGAELRSGAQTLGRFAQALLSAVKFKAAPFGVGLDIDPKAAIEQSQRMASAAAGSKAEPALESLYFNAEAELRRLTAGELLPLRLLVLVDDLDRCLPEKAIQVLESIKLFLNVPGFSFVLAVDDEVVERGIAHRYRDYRLADGGDEIPISGTQYLEKIVHLPLQLPRWTSARAAAFLRQRYPMLYGDEGGKPLLDLVLRATPLVPRKLIRLSEGIEFLLAQFSALGQTSAWSALHAARVVALQQLHPQLYRHLRGRAGRYWRLFGLDRNAWGEPQFRGAEGLSLSRAQTAYKQRHEAERPGDAIQHEQEVTARERLELLERVQFSGQQRGAGDPLDWFGPGVDSNAELAALGLGLQGFADLYFAAALPTPAAETAGLGEARGDENRPEAQVSELDATVAALLNTDALSRREALESRQLAGRRLPAAVFEALLLGLQRHAKAERLLGDLGWLQDIASCLSADQLLQLYRRAAVLERWLPAA